MFIMIMIAIIKHSYYDHDSLCMLHGFWCIFLVEVLNTCHHHGLNSMSIIPRATPSADDFLLRPTSSQLLSKRRKLAKTNLKRSRNYQNQEGSDFSLIKVKGKSYRSFNFGEKLMKE